MTNIDSDFLKSIWKEAKGYVKVAAAKDGKWEQDYLPWPGLDAVLAFYAEHEGGDLYYCPTIFATPDKTEPAGSYFIWVDFDGNKPEKSSPPPSTWDDNPTHRVQTSDPTNQHTYWELDRLYDARTVELANRLLAVKLKADIGSWDIHQLLRVPGSFNHKSTPAKPVIRLEPLEWEPATLSVETLNSVKKEQEVDYKLVKPSEINPEKIAPIYKYLEKGEWQKDRSNALYHIACLGFENGLNEDEVATVLHDADRNVIKKWSTRWNGEKLLVTDVARLLMRTRDKTRPDFSGLHGPTGGSLSAQAQIDTQSFWTVRPELEHIYHFSRAKLAPPWAVLGCVLARVIASTGPNLVVPATRGSRKSLNLFVALVGRSSGGKGVSNSVAEDAFDWPVDIHTATPGSGEGIIKLFKDVNNDGEYQHTHRVLLISEEINTWNAVMTRNGATLSGVLRSMYMGEQLGFAYANRDKKVSLKKHEYRACFTVAAQPEEAEWLLEEQSGGLPQRFIWMPADKTLLPKRIEDIPQCPEPMKWEVPDYDPSTTMDLGETIGIHTPKELVDFDQCDLVKRDILLDAISDSHENMEGHGYLTQIKVASALALLNGRISVNEEDWQLAQILMGVSRSTRSGILTVVQSIRKEKGETQAYAKAHQAKIMSDETEKEQRKKTANRIKTMLDKSDGPLLRSKLNTGIGKPYRDYWEEVLENLIELGEVVEVHGKSSQNKPTVGYTLAKVK